MAYSLKGSGCLIFAEELLVLVLDKLFIRIFVTKTYY